MINKELKHYLDTKILTKYHTYDRGHNCEHIKAVANASIELADGHNLDMDMVYTAAIYHDLGLIEGRDTHHLSSARMLREDDFITNFLGPDRTHTVAQAIEDHRASSKTKPRSIYGEILSSADRIIDPDTIIMRTYYYGLEHYPKIGFKEQLDRIYEHIQDKYCEGGYLKIPILTKKNEAGLAKLRSLANDENSFKQYCKRLIEEKEV